MEPRFPTVIDFILRGIVFSQWVVPRGNQNEQRKASITGNIRERCCQDLSLISHKLSSPCDLHQRIKEDTEHSEEDRRRIRTESKVISR